MEGFIYHVTILVTSVERAQIDLEIILISASKKSTLNNIKQPGQLLQWCDEAAPKADQLGCGGGAPAAEAAAFHNS